MIRGRPTLLDDPVVAVWDTAQSGTRRIPDQMDESVVALIEAFLAMDVLPGPSAQFQEELERRLADMAPVRSDPDPRAPGSVGAKTSSGHLTRIAPHGERGLESPRWMPVSAAAAVLALLALTGLFVLYRSGPAPGEAPAIPAAVVPKPELQTIAQFDFDAPMWGMPDATAWTHMEFGMMRIASESSFTTDAGWYTSVDGPLALTVARGDLEITPSGPALLSTFEQQDAPIELQAGRTVFVHPQDTIVFSAHDPVTGRNPGSGVAIAFFGIAGSLNVSVVDSTKRPTNVPVTNYDSSDTFQPLLSTGASITLQRVELQPFDSYVFDPGSNLRFVSSSYPARFEGLGMYSGVVETLPPNLPPRPIFMPLELRLQTTGAHTLVNMGDEPITLYFFILGPYPDPATPTP